MHPALKIIPVALLLVGSTQAMGQDNPRVLFCSGACFTVDAKGVRTPAPKGTQLAPGQRLETGPDAYAQVRLGRDGALGVGEQGRVRFDGNTVVLDQGRLRMIGGEALGRSDSRPVELRTGDGTFVLRSADVEVKKSAGPQSSSIPTFMKVNAGEASLRGLQGEVALPRDAVQGITAGKVVTGAPISLAEIAPATRATFASATPTSTPVIAPPPPMEIATPFVRQPILSPTLSPALSPTIVAQPSLTPVVSPGDRLLRQPVVDPLTGAPTTLTKVIAAPVSTSTTAVVTLRPITTTLPTITTTRTLPLK
jgi:hypothetical protein